jgi:hypothetical protein
MTDDDRAEMLLDIARRHQTTAWEVYQMARLCVFGPDAVDNPVFDPREEMRFDLARIEDLLDERPSIPELLSVWQHCHDVVVALIERQTNPDKRAKLVAALIEQEARMQAVRERLGIDAQDMREETDYSESFAECAETIHLRAGFAPKKRAAKGRG